jgi:hypothetical protein
VKVLISRIKLDRPILNMPPKGWGNDEITKFFELLQDNAYATYSNLQPWFQKFVAIDSAYRELIDNLNNSADWFAAFFVLRAHSNYLAAIRFSISGQIPETYSVLRSCLENGLYGFYLSRNPGSQETWLRRHNSEDHKQKVRDEFKVGAFLKILNSIDAKEGQVADTLYERAIDCGAHPNELALMQILKMTKDADKIEFKVSYAEGNSPQFQLALKTTAQVGVCVLGIFRLVYKERFDLIGLTDSLNKLRVGL